MHQRDNKKANLGVLQGGMLSPKLFTEFLQDISKSFDQSQGISVDTLLILFLLFVDDLFSDSANRLQKQLTALYKYASLWHIIVSISKTKVLIFNKRHTPECDNFYYCDNVIEKAENINTLVLYKVLKILRMLWKKRSFISLPKLVKQFILYTINFVP